MRTFKVYEKCYGIVNGKMALIMIIKQSPIWTKATLVGMYRNHGQGVVYVRVKTDSLLPCPDIVSSTR